MNLRKGEEKEREKGERRQIRNSREVGKERDGMCAESACFSSGKCENVCVDKRWIGRSEKE